MDTTNIIGFLFIVVVVASVGVHGEPGEPRCTSRFDYDYKIVEKLHQLEQSVKTLIESLAKSQEQEKGDTGSVYIRWGSNRCHEKSTLVYRGYTAGKSHADTGGGSDTVCLPEDPSWSNSTSRSDGWYGHVYGTEIDLMHPGGVFEHGINNHDIPCAACHIKKGTVLMIPGRSHCYSGWKQEYSGYLMTAYYNHPGPHNHVCVDHHPDSIPHGKGNDNQHILYLAVAKCGSLPCPPYVENRELACVVCSI